MIITPESAYIKLKTIIRNKWYICSELSPQRTPSFLTMIKAGDERVVQLIEYFLVYTTPWDCSPGCTNQACSSPQVPGLQVCTACPAGPRTCLSKPSKQKSQLQSNFTLKKLRATVRSQATRVLTEQLIKIFHWLKCTSKLCFLVDIPRHFLGVPLRSPEVKSQDTGVSGPLQAESSAVVKELLAGVQHGIFQVPRTPFDQVMPKNLEESDCLHPKRKQIRKSHSLSPPELSSG